MPTSIPYDSSLALGNIVSDQKLKNLEDIAKVQAPVDAAEEDLTLKIEMKRSLELTRRELASMNIDTSDLNTSIQEAGNSVRDSAAELAKQRIKACNDLVPLRANLSKISESIESPIDYNRTAIKQMPLSADSLKMNAQYFSFDENKQSSESTVAAIKGFVSASTSVLGTKRSMEATAAVQSQMSDQMENNELSGTLVITANCTHKDAVLLAPFVLDVDKAIRVWNDMFKDKKIKIDDVSSMQQIAAEEGTAEESKLCLLSGATYGSSFVGMVHILKTESTESHQSMMSSAASLQAQMETGNWFAKASGGFGVDSTFAKDVKNLLSNQQISSNVSIITMGSIPVIKSNEVQIGVKTFADFDPAAMMGKLATLANATGSDKNTVQDSAAAARTGGEMMQIRSSEIESVMSGLAKIDEGQNKMLDINSLMTAFEDYVDKALAGNIGVPITYYLKSITRAQLAQMWVAKYYPGEYLSISGDDSENTSS